MEPGMDRHTWVIDRDGRSPKLTVGYLTRLRRAFFILTEHATYRQRPTLEAAAIGLLMAATRPTMARHGRR